MLRLWLKRREDVGRHRCCHIMIAVSLTVSSLCQQPAWISSYTTTTVYQLYNCEHISGEAMSTVTCPDLHTDRPPN
jgi:hypothetical protein